MSAVFHVQVAPHTVDGHQVPALDATLGAGNADHARDLAVAHVQARAGLPPSSARASFPHTTVEPAA